MIPILQNSDFSARMAIIIGTNTHKNKQEKAIMIYFHIYVLKLHFEQQPFTTKITD